MLAVGLRLSREEFTAQQALSSRHVTFSITEACPLRCSHCIVDTVAASDRSRTLSVRNAQILAAGFKDLAARGVRFVSFTGGEPLLAFRQLRTLSFAAEAAGMQCSVVTACHWAATSHTATRVVEGLPAIQTWHISSDIFHEDYLHHDFVVRAAHAVVGQGRKCLVRMTANLPLSGRSQLLYDQLRDVIPAEVDIFLQPITTNGRATALNTDLLQTSTRRSVPEFPCVPNGMVVRYDCSVAPCCAGLVQQRFGHPFQYGLANEIGLAAVHEQWCTDNLLQLIRAVGFAPLLQWLREAFPDHELAGAVPSHPCECCLKLWKDPAVGPELRRRAESPAMAEKTARLTELLFGENFLRDRLENSTQVMPAD